MSTSTKAAKSIIIMIIFTIGSKLLGFIREMLIAAKFGSGVETDTFFVVVTATGLFSSVFIQSLNTTMIPVLADVEKNEGKEGKRYHTNNVLNIVLLISTGITIFAWILSPYIVKLVAHGFEGEQFKLAVQMMRIGLPVVICTGLVGVFQGYLQSESMFMEYSVSQFPYNFAYIFYLLILSSFFGIKGLMVTSVLAVFAQFLIQIPGARNAGFKYRLIINFKDEYIKRILHLVLPVLIGVSINDLNNIIDRSLASTLVEGSISALNYATRLNSFVLGIFVSTISTVLFPILSREAASETFDSFKKTIRDGVNIILIITIPATVGMIVLAEPIVKVVFERGAFDAVATQMTSQALIFYTLGLVGTAMRIFLEKVFYSLKDTKTPMINGLVAVGLNIVLNFIFIGSMAHRGLALATSISVTMATLYLFYILYKKINGYYAAEIIKCSLKSIFASLIMAVIVQVCYSFLIKRFTGSSIIELLVLLISTALGAGIYFIILYLLKVEELIWLISIIRKKFGK